MKINESMLKKMHEATQTLMSQGPAAATAAIQEALQPQNVTSQKNADVDVEDVIEVEAKVINTTTEPTGEFITKSYSNKAGNRDYKLYVPSGYVGQPLPLIVMLHGCTQNPDDFAAGTRMNSLAEEQNCLVAYPAQSQMSNVNKCWNWFSAIDQQRDQGEPSIIAGITHEITQTYAVDESRVYVAGLSAGGAMAVIMATLYPDLYAAVGVHSGLPHEAAHDLPSALAAMSGNTKSAKEPYSVRNARVDAIPIIVFHGDKDSTVHPSNAEQVMQENTPEAISSEIRQDTVSNGHNYTQAIFTDTEGKVLAESWLIHGAGHAWSGGSSQGSYTDGKGPDASQEMLRFFLSHKK